MFVDTWMHGGWGWGWMTLMMALMVLFWAAVIFGFVWVVRGTFDRRHPGSRTDSPEEILARRFAAGEISAEEYSRRRKVLAGGTATSSGSHNGERVSAA